MARRGLRGAPPLALVLAAVLGTACAASAPSSSATGGGRTHDTRAPVAGDALAVGGFGEVVVQDLQLRGAPGSQGNVISGVELTLGELVYVAESPRTVEGLTWYHVQLEDAFGWVAGGSDADAYLSPVQPPCGERPTTIADVEGGHPAIRLVCLGGGDIGLRGWVAETPAIDADCGCSAHPEWLADPFAYLVIESQDVAAWRGDPYGLKYRINPASGVAAPPTGQWVELTGHFDDPAAVTCMLAPDAPGGAAYDPVQVVVSCREQFVVSGWEIVAPP